MESGTQDKTFQQIPIQVKFKNLPLPVQERLLKRQRGEGEGFAFKTSGIGSSYFLIIAAALWFGTLFFLADDYLWSKAKVIFFGLITLAASYLFFYSAYKLARWLTSPSKCYLLITPLYVIEIYFNDIRYWNLEQFANINSRHHFQSGKYNFTEITLPLENGSKTIKIKNRETAEETVEQINYYRKLFIEATVRTDSEYLQSNDDFRELQNQTGEPAKILRGSVAQRFVTISASTVLAVGLLFAAIAANNFYDDKKSWNDAQTMNRASSYRTYLQTHLQGRWRADANQRLQTLYDEAEQKYKSSLNGGFDQKAVDAVSQVLRYAKATQNYRVKIIYERQNEIPSNIVEKLKKEEEVKTILPLDDAFSDEKMNRREGGLLARIADAVRQVIPDDILEISKDCPNECAVFLVKYKINADSVYYDSRQEKVPYDDRTFYPGIFIDWDFGVQIPNQPQIYNFELASSPAETITYDSDSLDDDKGDGNFADVLNADKSNIYDSMVSSAFDDFKANLIYKMGIGVAPEKPDDKPDESIAAPTTMKSRK